MTFDEGMIQPEQRGDHSCRFLLDYKRLDWILVNVLRCSSNNIDISDDSNNTQHPMGSGGDQQSIT
jgi:hypothetical protein